MKAVLEQISGVERKSVVYKYVDLPSFDAPFHYHPEMELTYIIKGRGTRYVGMKMEEFREGDFVFLGGNVPHCWLNETSEDNVKAFVIQFRQEVFSEGIFKLPEMLAIQRFFNKAQEGVKISGVKFYKQLDTIFKLNGASQIVKLIDLFVELEKEETEVILHKGVRVSTKTDRFHKVFSYIIENFRNKLSLDEVAKVAGLSPTSFCRYFKKVTGKKLFEVVLDYRLEAASQLLLSTNKQISEIAYDSGFEDIPYFNRVFKKQKGTSPREFRKGVE